MNPISNVAPVRGSVPLGRGDLKAMIRFVRAIHRLGQDPGYREAVSRELPESARFDPGNASVMMGYDFHLTAFGPRLIEVNTNAGGGLLAYGAHFPDFIAHPDRPPVGLLLGSRHILDLFDSFSMEMGLSEGGPPRRPARLMVMDQAPSGQFLYPEMRMLAGLFNQLGLPAAVVDPVELEASAAGVHHRGERVEMIYNRHCDFYLEQPELAGVREAYLAGSVCLSPNPRTYGLLADKRRMILWSDPARMRALGVAGEQADFLASVVLESRLLGDMDPQAVWAGRKGWVLKPVAASGSRGVLLGPRMTRKRFASLPPQETLVQRLAPPSMTVLADRDQEMKTDFRLFAYRDRVLGVAARVYRGQVTNFREPGSGYAPVVVA